MTSDAETAQEAPSGGPREVAVLLIRFPGDPAEPWSPQETREKVFTGAASANVFFQEESYGAIELTGKVRSDGDVFGWFEVNSPTADCPYETWDAKAREAAAEAGVQLTGYDHIIYISTGQSSCGFNGVAFGQGMAVHINGNLGPKTITHEVGHNLSLGHAGSWICTSEGVRVQISESCTLNVYGDPFDTMGNIATRHNNAWHLSKLGILTPPNTQTITDDGTYGLRAALEPTLEPTMLQIPRTTNVKGNVTSWYFPR